MGDKIYRIAQFGTFDVESMGDSLFPYGLRHGLEKQVRVETVLFSMRRCEDAYNGNGTVHAFEEFPLCHAEAPFDLVVLGGGEFLHFKRIRFTVDGKEMPYAAGYLWKKPIEMAREANVPYAVNCVGVSYDLAPSEEKELFAYLSDAVSVAVRDEFSFTRLAGIGLKNLLLAADNLWYMNEMYTKELLDQIRERIACKTGRDLTTPYMIVQYGTTKDALTLAEGILAVRRVTGLRILLLPLNYCHEDREGMRLLCEAGNGEFEAVDEHFEPPEILSIIAGASAFAGTSLHGNLTAASYGVPFVGIDMYPSFVSKMDGIFTMIGCEAYLVPSEEAVKTALLARLRDREREALVEERVRASQAVLDEYFLRLANCLRDTEHTPKKEGTKKRLKGDLQ